MLYDSGLIDNQRDISAANGMINFEFQGFRIIIVAYKQGNNFSQQSFLDSPFSQPNSDIFHFDNEFFHTKNQIRSA